MWTKRLTLWRFILCILFAVSAAAITVSADDDVPSESQCRPYIEKALKELESGDAEPDSAEKNDSSEVSVADDTKEENSKEDGGESQDESNVEASKEQDTPSLEVADEPYTTQTFVEDVASDNADSKEDMTEDNDSNSAETQNDDTDSKQDDDDSKQADDDSKQDDGEQDDSKQDDSKQDESTQDDSKQDDSKQADDNDSKTANEEGSNEEETDTKESVNDSTQDDDSKEDDDNKGNKEDINDEDDSKEEASAEDAAKTAEPGSDENSAKSEENVQESADESVDDDDNSKSAEDKVEEGNADEDDNDGQEVQESAHDDDDNKSQEEVSEQGKKSVEEDSNASKADDDESQETAQSEINVGANLDDDTKEDTDESKEDKDKDADDKSEEEKDETKEKESDDTNEKAGEDSSEDSKEEIDSKDAANKEDDQSEETESDGTTEQSDEPDDGTDEEESTPEEDLLYIREIPDNLRSRDHINQILRLDEEQSEAEITIERSADIVLRDLKRLYESSIKPLEALYKYRDLSNRHFGDPEIFSKPLVLFMGPWSGGKSSIVNYLTGLEFTEWSLRTGAEPSPAYFNILMHGKDPEVLDGTQLAADWTFSGLQKFGQGLEERLRGLKYPSKILEKVNIVEIPGILEVRKQVSRVFPFNDACQWFIDRADIIFLVYDPSKLDVGPETEAILDQLKGRESQTRIVLNKADIVKPEELMRVQSALIWNISPLMSSAQPPVMYTVSLWSMPYEAGAPVRLLQAQERELLRDLRQAVDKRIENKIASARRFAVRVRNHAKMVDCYLTTYYNHKTIFGNRKLIADAIIENPQNYHIYEGLSTLTNISRYDLPDPETYRDFFRLNALYEFQQLSATCTYFRGCPITRLDVAIAYDLPELVGKYKKMVETATPQGMPKS